MQLFGTTGLFVSLCLLIGVGHCDGAVTQKPNDNQPTAQSLYNASDSVVVLNATIFKSTVYSDSKGWLVEFYNSWCGYCIRYAPIWKDFASDVYSWNDIVVIAAIDCANEDNTQICREYEIGSFPTLKYFSASTYPSQLGTVIAKVNTVDGLRHNLIETLVKEQEEGRDFSWPNINPYRNNETGNVWMNVPNIVQYFFLIFEAENSSLGAEVILDLHNVTILQIRRVTSNNRLWIETNNVTKFPSVIVFNRNGSQGFVNLNDSSRHGIVEAITTYLTLEGVELGIEENNTHRWITGNIVTSQEPSSIEEETKSATSEDQLYQLDLENVLRYSVFHEIPLSHVIKDEKFEALKHYVSLLAGYFPFKHNNTVLKVIRDVLNNEVYILGKQFIEIVKHEEEKSSMFSSSSQEWVGCKGSEPGFRGYPCGLWTLYHTLSVNFAMQNEGNTQIDPTEVLKTMHGYVKNFFGCADCVQHFLQMASKNRIFEVRTGDECILWLWKAHNEVNARLAGDATEDPKHKKIQYPAAKHCPLCRYANDSWDEEQVLNYLKKKYSYAAIVQSNGSAKLINCQNSLQYLLLLFILLSTQYLQPSPSFYA